MRPMNSESHTAEKEGTLTEELKFRVSKLTFKTLEELVARRGVEGYNRSDALREALALFLKQSPEAAQEKSQRHIRAALR